MELNYNVAGRERKRMAVAIGEILGIELVYKGMPSYDFKIGDYTVNRYGTLLCPDIPEAQKLVQALMAKGFMAQQYQALAVEMPRTHFTEAEPCNLMHLIESKEILIRNSLGVNNLPVEITEEAVRFPWFTARGEADETAAYIHFVSALCEMAKGHLRIKTQSKKVSNEKYAFRCFLLRLGFIGPEYKAERKILLRNLTGSSAFLSEDSKLKAAFKRKVKPL